ncbi:MFS transporter [Paraburkholderia oxyphila]|uniref:MFS transporter n=1 Tax=Paraburkholderia oxyphila TaxID=614212 RepID=UPI0005BCF1FA|nr:MFS transporter [Paraburkholderia oxyphila]
MESLSGMTRIESVIDSRPLTAYHIVIFMLCFVVMMADGYDTASIGLVVPSIVADWGVARASLGPVVSAALVGFGVGALFAGPLADRTGRRKVFTLSIVCFGLASAMSASSNSIGMMTVLRLVTGLGLGAAMPNAVIMVAEYAPVRVRAFAVNAVAAGFAVGLATGGAMAAWLIPNFGWRSVLAVGGIWPLVMALVVWAVLPESPKFLAVKGGRDAEIARILSRLSRGELFEGVRFLGHEHGEDASGNGRHSASIGLVISAHYRFRTLMLWLIYFLALLVFYLLTNWLPTLFRDAGFSVSASALMTSLFPLGGAIGNLIMGRLMDRYDGNRTISLAWLVSAALLLLVGLPEGGAKVLGIATFVTGAVVTGAVSAMTAYAASIYPTEGRATGVAWMLGIGRIGGVAGAFAGAVLTGMGLKFATILALLAVPALSASILLRFLAWRGGHLVIDDGSADIATLH